MSKESNFDESKVNRARDGKFDFKKAGAPVVSLNTPQEIQFDEILPHVQKLTHYEMNRQGVFKNAFDYDDVVSNVIADLWTSYKDRGGVPRPVLTTAVKRAVSRSSGHLNLNPTDRKAMTIISEEKALREEELGRKLSSQEHQELADYVRQTWHDPNHRPSKNLLEKARMAQMGTIIREDGSMVEGINAFTSSDSFEGEDQNSEMGRANHLLNSGQKEKAKLEVWDALASMSNAPRVQRASYNQRVVVQCRSIMNEYPGGVLGAVDTWERAEDDEGTAALFAPFGSGLDEDGRDRVCAMLKQYPQNADDLWNAALNAAKK
ncbi:hypothetical protein [Actinomyces vulturis]|uniref:hypothetical protein n=1 Tax=Actinomyces vulturis TaxID=1857645 RepID=UPI0008313FD8|nr:hypothetical protein [Actinomyces vulturis]